MKKKSTTNSKNITPKKRKLNIDVDDFKSKKRKLSEEAQVRKMSVIPRLRDLSSTYLQKEKEGQIGEYNLDSFINFYQRTFHKKTIIPGEMQGKLIEILCEYKNVENKIDDNEFVRLENEKKNCINLNNINQIGCLLIKMGHHNNNVLPKKYAVYFPDISFNDLTTYLRECTKKIAHRLIIRFITFQVEKQMILILNIRKKNKTLEIEKTNEFLDGNVISKIISGNRNSKRFPYNYVKILIKLILDSFSIACSQKDFNLTQDLVTLFHSLFLVYRNKKLEIMKLFIERFFSVTPFNLQVFVTMIKDFERDSVNMEKFYFCEKVLSSIYDIGSGAYTCGGKIIWKKIRELLTITLINGRENFEVIWKYLILVNEVVKMFHFSRIIKRVKKNKKDDKIKTICKRIGKKMKIVDDFVENLDKLKNIMKEKTPENCIELENIYKLIELINGIFKE